jgi:hypothetical protein
MQILIIEPYFTGSHKAWAEGYQKHSAHDVKILSLGGQFWKWRMHGGAITLAHQFLERVRNPDLILATDMLDVTTFLTLTTAKTSQKPVAIYFHENQFCYPWSPEDRDVIQKRDRHYAFINYSSALAADAVLFNSAYQKDCFLNELTKFLKHFPDHRGLKNVERIAAKSEVLHLGLDLHRFDQHKPDAQAKIEFSPKGINVNDKLQTTARNIYAIGDVVGSYQFSHIAEYHAGIAVPNALLPLPIKRKVNYENIVWTTFTDPEFARGGLTETEAKQKYGNKIKVYKFNYDRVDRAKTDLATIGMSKYIVDKKGKLLGIHIIGERAGELLHEAQLAKSMGIPFHKIQSMVHVYPTYGDMVKRPAVAAYVDKLQNNFFIKMLRKLRK